VKDDISEFWIWIAGVSDMKVVHVVEVRRSGVYDDEKEEVTRGFL
jgi:hypothetical protein